MTDDSRPRKLALCLFPGFQALDVFGPFDAFNFLSMSHPELELVVLSSSLDPVPTRPSATFSQSVLPTHTYSDTSITDSIDAIFVPGGIGLRDPGLDQLENWLKAVVPKVKYVLTVCTGSALLARTGFLDGRTATTNKRSWDWATAQGPKVDWVRKARWIVDDKGQQKLWTSSGVSAGIDMALAWIESVYGAEEAKAIADRMEYVRSTDSTNDPFA